MKRSTIIVCSLLAILVVTAGCSEKSIPTNRPYVFVEDSGNEIRGLYSQPEMPSPVLGKSGVITVFYEDGTKWIEGSLINGQFNGMLTMWRPDGTMFIQETYAFGIKNGQCIWYNPDGTVDFTVDWLDGKKKP